ncbi:MAG: hypothetical protein WHS77_09665, partial [Brevinematales bacterium]
SKIFDYWEISIEGYLKSYVNLISRVSNIELEFKMNEETDNNSKLEFDLGNKMGGVIIDEVSLIVN